MPHVVTLGRHSTHRRVEVSQILVALNVEQSSFFAQLNGSCCWPPVAVALAPPEAAVLPPVAMPEPPPAHGAPPWPSPASGLA